MCSESLILGALVLLRGKEATTDPTVRTLLEDLGVTVVNRPFVPFGNIVTAAGSLAGLALAGWVIEEKDGENLRDPVTQSVMPVGE